MPRSAALACTQRVAALLRQPLSPAGYRCPVPAAGVLELHADHHQAGSGQVLAQQPPVAGVGRAGDRHAAAVGSARPPAAGRQGLRWGLTNRVSSLPSAPGMVTVLWTPVGAPARARWSLPISSAAAQERSRSSTGPRP